MDDLMKFVSCGMTIFFISVIYFSFQIDDLLMQLYYLYRRSAKKWKELKAMAAVLKTNVVKPVRAQGTRWIDHRRKALQCLATNYKALVAQFEDVASGQRKDIAATDVAKLKGYLMKLKSAKFLTHMSLYMSLVEDMADLSLSFQKDDVPVSDIRTHISLALAGLKRQLEAPGPHLRPLVTAVNEVIEKESGQFLWCSVEINIDPYHGGLTAFTKQVAEIVKDIIDCIGDSSFTDHPVLNTSDILDHVSYPTDLNALLEYGNEDVATIVDHFRPLLEMKGCNTAQVQREWIKIKDDIIRHHKREKFIPLWRKMLVEKQHKYPNFLHIIRILLVCPVSTTQVERQFSSVKRILGDWRLKLKTGTIEDLLRICTEGPEPAGFCPESAVLRWWSSGRFSRKPSIQARSTAGSSPTAETSDSELEYDSSESECTD